MSLPETYYGRLIASDGVFHEDEDVIKIIDDVDETFFYGRTIFKSGPTIPFCRIREEWVAGQQKVN